MNKGRLAIIFIISLAMAGCPREQGLMRETIRQYCLLLAEGYQELDMHRLRFVATEEQTAKVYTHMAALGEGRLKMASKLLNVDFLTIQENPLGHGQVKTREEWDYNYWNIDSGKPELSNKVLYTMLYHLEKVNDRWLVAAIDIEQSSQSHDQSIPAFVTRPASKPLGSQSQQGGDP
jgi:hypothetical protein